MDINNYIKPLYMNGLIGRMVRIPTKNKSKKREFLVIYGHHSSIERMSGYLDLLSNYGNVTMPDLPGFGGMESFYKIGEVPSIENYADYLAAFIKLRYKNKKFVIVGMSFSVPVFVKMLQKYPEIEKNVEFSISLVGFVHHEDFSISKTSVFWFKLISKIASYRYVAFAFSKVFLRASLVKNIYRLFANKHARLIDAPKEEQANRIEMETKLWLVNDFRTRMYTLREMLKVDLCDRKLSGKIHNLVTLTDMYFNKEVVSQHMQIIYGNGYKEHISPLKAHAPSVTANSEEIKKLLPKSLQKVIDKQ